MERIQVEEKARSTERVQMRQKGKEKTLYKTIQVSVESEIGENRVAA